MPDERSHSRALRIPTGCVRPASSSSSSSPTTSEQSNESTGLEICKTRPPDPLRLPFDDRKRESRLVSDEDLDEIIARTLRTSQVNRVSMPIWGAGIGTSDAASVRKRKRFSLPTHFLGHDSARFDTLLSHTRASLHQDQECVTALPTAPTRNHIAICYPSPDDDVFGPVHQTKRDPFTTKADIVLGRNTYPNSLSTPAIHSSRAIGPRDRKLAEDETVDGTELGRRFSASAVSLALGAFKNRIPRYQKRGTCVQTQHATCSFFPEPKIDPIGPCTSPNAMQNLPSRIETIQQQHRSNKNSSAVLHETTRARATRLLLGLNRSSSTLSRSRNHSDTHPTQRTKADLHAIITSHNSQISDLKLQNSLMHEQLDKLRGELGNSEAQLGKESGRAGELSEENWQLKCRIEELQTHRRRSERGGAVVQLDKTHVPRC